MKALSLTQPWATLVALGVKKIETRSWSTEYRGPLAIHASQGITKDSLNALQLPEFRRVLTPAGYHYLGDMPRGAVIAICELVDVIPTDDVILDVLARQERDFGDFGPRRFAWTLANVKRLETPVPAKGMLSLWEWTKP